MKRIGTLYSDVSYYAAKYLHYRRYRKSVAVRLVIFKIASDSKMGETYFGFQIAFRPFLKVG